VIKQWLMWLSFALLSVGTVIAGSAIVFGLKTSTEIVLPPIENSRPLLTKNSFTLSQEAYQAIGTACLQLKYAPVYLQLPDLRNILIYSGKNGRPDAKVEREVFHFLFNGSPTTASIAVNEPLYLFYDRTKLPSQYTFSPNNEKTALWIKAFTDGQDAIVSLFMEDNEGHLIQKPQQHAQFRLAEKDNFRIAAGRNWDIGKWRVDGTLLVRQKACWKGPDAFLERHGGEEFAAMAGKQRIDFTDEESSYSVYVGLNDNMIWDGQKWKVATVGDETLKYPLMTIKKIDDRLMTFELWDVSGKGKAILNLVKTNDPLMGNDTQKNFKCLGARTRSQYIFEMDGQRILLTPKDWLLRTPEGWIKLSTVQEIDDYVERRLQGPLFVFDGVISREGRQMLLGSLFNPARTERQEIELPVLKATTRLGNLNEDDLDDDDEDDDDDENDDDY
jgi:hypothetical protein